VTSAVAAFAGSRGDIHPLGPVLAALHAAPDVDLTLLAADGVAEHADLAELPVELLGVPLDVADPAAMAAAGSRLGLAIATALVRIQPRAFVVLGDRWELLHVVPPVVLAGIPLVHLHGGEVTEGAVDDRVRHAVTKLADLHCVSTEQAAARVRQLGEPAERVTVTGAPSLDRMAQIVPAGDDELAALLHGPVSRPFALVTYHASTAGGPDPTTGARNILEAVAATTASAVITHPGMDLGRDAVLAEIHTIVGRLPQFVDVPGLGERYLAVLAAADVVVGNSSSGIIEAASLGVPVVNVGDRQRGRPRSGNVVDAAEERAAIEDAVRRSLSAPFREQAATAVNVYGDGKAAPRVLEVVRRAVAGGLARKPFVDLT
jgi:UDP-N-acetylglucosamine 2-epimerase (non-hydrolysing)